MGWGGVWDNEEQGVEVGVECETVVSHIIVIIATHHYQSLSV